jgi:hypothetical protein
MRCNSFISARRIGQIINSGAMGKKVEMGAELMVKFYD